MKQSSVAKVLEVGPYPPPMAGWSIRIRFVKEKLEAMGHDCKVLNLGKNRKIPSKDYITVRHGVDYVFKTCWYAARGYTIHMHTNGDGLIGFLLSLIAAIAGRIFGRPIVLSLHAGTHQRYFPRERSKYYFPVIYLIFKLPKTIICNNEAVKEKITEYGISPDKIIPIKAFGVDYIKYCSLSVPAAVEKFFDQNDTVIFTYAFLREGFYWDTLVEALRLLRERRPKIGVINAGALEDNEPAVKTKTLRQIEKYKLDDRMCFAGDLSHDEFLGVLSRAILYLRTPTTDGECSSVLESLIMGVPVVASDNNNRPPSVVTYQADDPKEMCLQIDEVIRNNQRYRDQIIKPTAEDTVSQTAMAILRAALG